MSTSCPHTGLPSYCCAHCINGLPTQLIDDNRGYRQDRPISLPIGIPALSLTIKRSLTPDTAPVHIGSGRRIETPSPRTRWGMEQQMKTFHMLIGLNAGGIDPPKKERDDDDNPFGIKPSSTPRA